MILLRQSLMIILFITNISSNLSCDVCKNCSNPQCCSYCELEKNTTACNTRPHIACPCTVDKKLPQINLLKECVNKTMKPITSNLRQLLLNEHNDWRNQLAEGAIHGYPAATKMIKMQWDQELSDVAEIHANFCVFEHDKCRATLKYPKSGQNLALKLYSRPYTNLEKMIREMVAEWFEEYKLIPPDKVLDIVDRYQHDDKWGHFAIMAKDKNEAVGCALVSMENYILNAQLPYHFMLTCHYANTNILNAIMYEHGRSCSHCDAYGKDFRCDSKEYHRLCYNSTKDFTDESNNAKNVDIDTKQFKMCHESSISKASKMYLSLIIILFRSSMGWFSLHKYLAFPFSNE